MQSIAGFFKKVISSSSANDIASDEVLRDEKWAKTVVTDKGDNSCNENDPVEEMTEDMKILKDTVYDLLKDIRDPEKPQTLEELNVISEDGVFVRHFNEDDVLVKVVFVPTVPHCSLASIIGLCMRQKLVQNLPEKPKLDIFIKEGTHETADEINKQINDKERIAAAMENPNLRDLVNKCISEEESFR